MKKNIKITFFSNFLLHHQTPFCEAMVGLIGDGFRFVATTPVPEDRRGMGYHDYTDTAYCVNAYKSENEYQRALRLGYESDVVIIGSASDEFIEKRLKENKLTFRYCERYFKQGRWRILDPRVMLARYKTDFRYRNKNLYMLCASAYTASDCRFIHSYPNKTYKWGYFPPVKRYEDINAVIASKRFASILWAGRFIWWKHPEATLCVAKRLKENGYEFEMNLIGGGGLEGQITDKIREYGLEKYVHLLGTMSPEEVRERMEQAEIFLFTSDRNEGWGAVLNESMNSACATVASGAIGSVPYLIDDGENGLIYKDGDLDDLYGKVKFLLDNPDKRRIIAANAYNTLCTTWNAETASARLLELIENLREGRETPFESGPCSKD